MTRKERIEQFASTLVVLAYMSAMRELRGERGWAEVERLRLDFQKRIGAFINAEKR